MNYIQYMKPGSKFWALPNGQEDVSWSEFWSNWKKAIAKAKEQIVDNLENLKQNYKDAADPIAASERKQAESIEATRAKQASMKFVSDDRTDYEKKKDRKNLELKEFEQKEQQNKDATDAVMWTLTGIPYAVQHLVSPNGVVKTYGNTKAAVQNGGGPYIEKAVASAAGDVLDATILAAPLFTPEAKLARAMNKNIRNTTLQPTVADEAILRGQLGWAPKQTIYYRHGSLDPELKTFVPKHDRWDVVTHGADPNMYFVTDQSTPVSAANMMDLRPYQYTGSIVAEKPMVQVGDFNVAGKNATRNQLIARARQQGADTYLLQDIVDNKVPHQNVVARFIGPEGEAVQGGALLQTKTTPTKTSLAFFERNPANITHAQKLGLTKHDRYGLGSFKSDLDWTAHKWMKDNIGGYNIQDVMALQSHVPEYLKLEQKFKGTTNWLKMRNGKTYIDDPRGWIQLQSKNGRIFDDSPIYTGVKTGVVDPNYNGIFWGTYDNGWISQYQARAYAPNDVSTLELVVPNNVKTYTQTHDGNTSWFALGGKEKPLLTNDVVETHFNNGIDRVNIRGIIDMGPNTGNIHSSKYNKLFDYTTHQGIIDEKFNAKFPQNDVIINQYVPRKSIIGNNGNFNLDDSNIYRKQGGSIHIKKKNRGKFTDYCGGKVTEECIRKGKNSSNPTTRKRANFAWVARHKFKHEEGGKINYLNYFK